MPAAILQQIESLSFDSAAAEIISHVSRFPNERFYAGAFWLCYVDYTTFGTACFALNTESHLQANDPLGTDALRWSPPNWQLDVSAESIQAMSPLYQALSHSLAGQDDTVWDTAIEEHFQTLARVSRKLTHHARSRSGPFTQTELPPDFVVGIFEEREGEPNFSRLVRASITPEILSTLPSPLWETT